MDVKTLCLGLLSFNEASGYDLKKEFESIFKHFYPAGFGSIYPALADLAERELVSCREVARDGRPARKVYRITSAGRRAFAQALRDTNPQHKVRSEFLAMIYFAELMDADALEELLDKRLDEIRASMVHIQSLQQHLAANSGARFVTGFGMAIAQAAADYIESNRNVLVERKTTGGRRRNASIKLEKSA